MTVSVTRDGDVAIVTIDNPPVNAASVAVRKGLMAALAETEADAGVRAVVLTCAGSTFVAGADMREFDQPPQAPLLPDVVSALEGATKPWVAVIHGTALGGGLEIALGCHLRMATRTTKMGLPEVTLGLIPGAGGTVRLPRLIDPVEAVTMIGGGKPVPAARALDIGLVDAVSDGNLLADALALASQTAEKPLPTPLTARSSRQPGDPAAWEAALARIRKSARGQNAPHAAIAQLETSLEVPADQALAAERAAFLALKADPQSAALRHIFFAERAVSRLPELKGVAARRVETICVVGGGTMGAGIAAACLLSGLERVILIERDEKALTAGLDRVTATLDTSLKRGVISETRRAELAASLSGDTDYGAVADADLVIEAVFEDMEVKKAVFVELDRATRPDAILATNTSYLDVNEIARATSDPSRVLGLHFFSPAHIMKLLEIVVTDHVAGDVLATAFTLARKLGKIAVAAGVCDGFIGNRIMSAYRRTCDAMLLEGARPEQIDAAMRDFGFPMGLYAMQDLAGLDIAWTMRKRRGEVAAIADRLCALGRFGRKTGQGWYDYTDDPAGAHDPVVTDLVASEAARQGVDQRPFTGDQIMSRILITIQEEGRRILAEGIARTAEAIDVVMVNGYGFPRWRGGPMFMAAAHDKD